MAGGYNSPHFEEPADGLIYVGCALGSFRSKHSISFEFRLEVIRVRAYSPLWPCAFFVLWGYPWPLQAGDLSTSILSGLVLVSAIIAHGIFDFLLFTQSALPAGYTFLPGHGGSLCRQVRHANKISIYIDSGRKNQNRKGQNQTKTLKFVLYFLSSSGFSFSPLQRAFV